MGKERELSLEGLVEDADNHDAMAAARELLDAFRAGAPPDWWVVLFSRQVGTGKSTIAGALAADACRLGVGARFDPEPELVGRMRDAAFDDGEDGLPALMGRLIAAPLLVIDDLGTEKPTDFALARLFWLFDARMRRQRPLVVTTNLEPGELKEVYGARIWRRLRVMTRQCELWIELAGGDRSLRREA